MKRIALVCLFAFPALCAAEQIWSVDSLVERALSHNPELKAFEAEVAAVKGERTQAGLWKNPELSLEYGERRVSEPGGPLNGDGSVRGIAVMQPFDFPGKGSLRKAIAGRNIEIAELGLEQFRLALKGKVRQLAYRLAADSQNLEIACEISEYSGAQVDLLKHRLPSGIQGLLDQRVIEASLLEVKLAMTELEASREEASTQLNALLGLPPSQRLKLKVALQPPSRRLDPNQMVGAALRHNFQLRTREKEIERADFERTAAYLGAAPDFAIGPFYSREKAADDEVNLGIALRITVPLWDFNQGHIAAADARLDRARYFREKARYEVEAEVLRRYGSYRLALKRLEDFQKGYVEKMHDAADLADRHYRLGAVNVQTFMEIQKQYLNAGRSYGNAVLSAHENLLDLEILTGGKGEVMP